MKRIIYIIFFLISCNGLLVFSCIGETHVANTPLGNFDELWKIIDERYCFHEYKNISWNTIYTTYREMIYPDMSNDELFYVLSAMLNELKDGHVNLIANDEQVSAYRWTYNSLLNFNEQIIRSTYLINSHTLADDVKYSILSDNIGYIYYPTFSSDVKTQHMDLMFNMMERCKGLIIDVRHNGGGNIGNARRLNSRFTEEKILTGYIKHKTGKGHNDFSSPTPIYIEPSKNVRWNKKVVVLTNRHTYSAANDFTNNMRYIPNTILMGDTTGGGSGLPFSYELPNGWAVRFSACPHFDASMNQIEFGIAPDIRIDMDVKDASKSIDTIIEAARQYILNHP